MPVHSRQLRWKTRPLHCVEYIVNCSKVSATFKGPLVPSAAVHQSTWLFLSVQQVFHPSSTTATAAGPEAFVACRRHLITRPSIPDILNASSFSLSRCLGKPPSSASFSFTLFSHVYTPGRRTSTGPLLSESLKLPLLLTGKESTSPSFSPPFKQKERK